MSKGSSIKRVVSNQLVQAILIYISGGWIALEITDYIINNYGLNSQVRDVLAIVLLAGLPIVVFLAWYLSREKEEAFGEKKGSDKEGRKQKLIDRFWRRRWFFLPGLIVFLLLLLTGIRALHKQNRISWALEEVVPKIHNLLNDWEYAEAFRYREEIKEYISDHPEFLNLDSMLTKKIYVLSEPLGVDVYFKEYNDTEGDWIFLGTTPVEGKEMPIRTLYRWKFAKSGYNDVYAATNTYQDTLFRTIHKSGNAPEGMVYVEGIGGQTSRNLLSQDKLGFFIDKYEVTNSQYKEFLDNGGYGNPDYWKVPFVLRGDTLSFENALALFTDATGRPGPATWEAGDFPSGEEDYPVNGISWYEAAAFAHYAGKSLPTSEHWRSASGSDFYFYHNYTLGSYIVPFSNFSEDGLRPVGSGHDLNCYGLHDNSGNVREWCWNKSPNGRIILGGAWNDATYMSRDISQAPAFDRSVKNGFRCAYYPDKGTIPENVFQPVHMDVIRDISLDDPVSDPEFQIIRNLFQYDTKELNGYTEERDDSPEDWIMETVSFDAAYDGDRVQAILFLPKNALPPFQTLIYFPGSGALDYGVSIFEYGTTRRNLYYLIKNGRAVMFPIYYGTFNRKAEECNSSEIHDLAHQFTECLVKWVKDLRRSLDYLESREDIDMSRIGFLGDSWGGRLGLLIPAVEDRLKLNILLRGGLSKAVRPTPEVDEINYVTRVKIPTLMLNGRYDFTFPYESSVKPMFDLLGTPEEDKKLVLCDMDHYIPTSVMVKEVLDWLDQYFGPVNK